MIALSASPLRPDLIQAAVSSPDCGATICFIGTARNTRAFPAGAAERAVRALSYEAYAPMAIAEMAEIRAEALRRWPGARDLKKACGRSNLSAGRFTTSRALGTHLGNDVFC